MTAAFEDADEVYGVDFSGAKDAGRKIWVAGGPVGDDGVLDIETWCAVADLDGGGTDLEDALCALRQYVEERPDAVFGFDFPFGLPEGVVEVVFDGVVDGADGADDDWRGVVEGFEETFANPNDFREQCSDAAGDGSRLRETDAVHGGWSPYHWMLHKQTYHGIAGVLAPLVADGGATGVPMEAVGTGGPWLLEVYPAATLARGDLYVQGYRGDSERARERRETNIRQLSEDCDVSRDVADIASRGHHTHDALVAAAAALRTRSDGPTPGDEPCCNEVEGHIYA